MAFLATPPPWLWGAASAEQRAKWEREDWHSLQGLLLGTRRAGPRDLAFIPQQIQRMFKYGSAVKLTPHAQTDTPLDAWMREATLNMPWERDIYKTLPLDEIKLKPVQRDYDLRSFEPRPLPTYAPPAPPSPPPRIGAETAGMCLMLAALMSLCGMFIKRLYFDAPKSKSTRRDSDANVDNLVAQALGYEGLNESEDNRVSSIEQPPTYWECTGTSKHDDLPPPYSVCHDKTAAAHSSDTTLTFENGRVLERPTTTEMHGTEVPDTSQPTRGRVLLV